MQKVLTTTMSIEANRCFGPDLEAMARMINDAKGKITKIVVSPTHYDFPEDNMSRPYALAVVIFYEENATDFRPIKIDLGIQLCVEDFHLENISENLIPEATVILPYYTSEVLMLYCTYA